MKGQSVFTLLFVLTASLEGAQGFAGLSSSARTNQRHPKQSLSLQTSTPLTTTTIEAAPIDLDTVGLVAGQENFGFAVVCLGEAIWSFLQEPSVTNAKVLVPGAIAAVLLVAVSGPMITSGDAGTVGTGLWIATGVSVALGLSYVVRYVQGPFVFGWFHFTFISQQ